MNSGICFKFICEIYLLLCLIHSLDAVKCYGNHKGSAVDRQHLAFEPIKSFKEKEIEDDQWEACIVGLFPSEVYAGKQNMFILAVGSTLINYYSNEWTNSFCPEGYAVLRLVDEALVTNFQCDERVYSIAFICKTDLCNKKEKLPFWDKISSDSTTICPNEDFNIPNALEGKKFTRRDYVINCYVTRDQHGILWGLDSNVHNLLPLMEPYESQFCIIGYTKGGQGNKENRPGKFFRQSAVTTAVLCPEGMKLLEEEEKKKRKEARDKAIKDGTGTGSSDDITSFNVGVEVTNLECENVIWEKAYICNFDACNVDDGCHGIPLQYTGANSKRTCTQAC